MKKCECCERLLVEDRKGQRILSKFPYSTNIREFSHSAGVGLFLYFYFMKICLWIIFIVAILSSCPFIYLSYYTRQDLKHFCKKNSDNYLLCRERVNNSTNWLLAMSSDNFKIYKNITKEIYINNKISLGYLPEWSLVDYNFISLITQLLLLFVYLIFYNNVVNQSAEVDIVTITASDYALIISEFNGIELDNFEKLRDYLKTVIIKMLKNTFICFIYINNK